MKLADFGELFRLVDWNDRLSDDVVKYIFNQVVQGLSYLHDRGIVHRDIKPENILIDSKCRAIIADFNFATRLEKHLQKSQATDFNPKVIKNFCVGSESYNAPELWEETRGEIVYDGIKADVFSAATTFFLMTLKFQPFRRATLKDPYYKRLVLDQKAFWKIFREYPIPDEFKDLFERMSALTPKDRLSTEEILQHRYLQSQQFVDERSRLKQDGADNHIKMEITQAFSNVQRQLGKEYDPFTDEVSSSHASDSAFDFLEAAQI